MAKPSPPVYHLGPIVTAHAVASTTVAVAGSVWLSELLGLSAMAPFWAATIIIAPLVAAEPTRRSEQTKRFGPANQITLLRAILIAAIASLLGSAPTNATATWASIGAVVALGMDGIDGWVARKTDSTSAYGAQYDMELDSIFTLLLCVLVFDWGHAGPWVLFCGLARYVWMAIAATTPWFNRPLPPSFRRKTACVVGVGTLSLALTPWSNPMINTLLAGSATVALAGSFAIDAIWLIQRKSDPIL